VNSEKILRTSKSTYQKAAVTQIDLKVDIKIV